MRAGWLGWILFAGGCQFVGPPTAGTEFRCDDGLCPTGFSCRAGACVESDERDAAPVDADTPRPNPGRDAAERPQPRPDPRPDAPDAAVDAPPGPVSRTLIFGEQTSSDVRGVTTDTWLDSANTDVNRGQATELQIDREPTQVALIRFDITAIPSGSVVEDAFVRLQVSDPAAKGDRLTARVLLRAWNEREATWNQASNGVRWPTAGAGGAAVGDAIGSVSPDEARDFALDLDRDAVQAWVDDPDSNFGLRLDVASSSANDVRVRSREGVGNGRPYLRVRFHDAR